MRRRENIILNELRKCNIMLMFDSDQENDDKMSIMLQPSNTTQTQLFPSLSYKKHGGT